MRIILAALILVGAVHANGLRDTPVPFSIHIVAPYAVVKSGSGIFIQIRMRNNSDHDIECTSAPQDELDMNYAYEVRDNSGQILPESHRNVPEEGDGGSGRARLVKPGETVEAIGGFISNHYDMRKPGQYVIVVSRQVPGGSKNEVVKSNPVTITVIP
jgi:hypothetical protein